MRFSVLLLVFLSSWPIFAAKTSSEFLKRENCYLNCANSHPIEEASAWKRAFATRGTLIQKPSGEAEFVSEHSLSLLSEIARNPGVRRFSEENVIVDQPKADGGEAITEKTGAKASGDQLTPFEEGANSLPGIILYSNKRVDRYIRLYSTKFRESFTQGLVRGKRYFPLFRKIFREYNLPEELIYLSVVESNINPHAVSRARATGIWQFMRHTGGNYGLKSGWWVDERRDPIKSTHAAAQHLRDLYRKFENWELALAAYNAGIGKISRAIRKNLRNNRPTDYHSLRIPRETRNYVPKLLAVTAIIKNPEKYGFDTGLFRTASFPEFKTIRVGSGVSFKQIAKKFSIPIGELKFLNSRYALNYTPLNQKSNELRIPSGAPVSKSMIASLKKDLTKNWGYYRVRPGDSLWSISRRHAVSVHQIKAMNPDTKKRRYLKVGLKLLIPFPTDQTVADSGGGGRKNRLVYHRVRRGDSLYKIARKYRVRVSAIIKANKSVRSVDDIIKIGTRLLIPRG